MEIDNHILSLSMEFERQNIIINEYETNKAKFAHDRAYKRRNRTAKRISEPENNGAKGDEEAYEGNMCIMFYILNSCHFDFHNSNSILVKLKLDKL